MCMTELQVLERIVRPVLADSLGIERERNIWLSCQLREDLGASEQEDLVDIVWRMNRCFRESSLDIIIDVSELQDGRIKVSEVVTLIYRKLVARPVLASN